MERSFYLNLAASGLRMPIGTDLVLHEQPAPGDVLEDGVRLAQVVLEAARRFNTPLALAHMDLEVEKEALLSALGVPLGEIAQFHFHDAPDAHHAERLAGLLEARPTRRMQAQIDAVRRVAAVPGMVPVAMCIGPFSLMTKLLADPITPVCMAGSGVTAAEDPDILRMERAHELAFRMVRWSIEAKIAAGAKAICIAEPAANKVYLSPRQIEQGSDIFERYVMRAQRDLRQLMADHGVDLVFHCCGELVPSMVRAFASLDAAILSLGSSRKLWEDAQWVPKQTVLFGNLPSKRFYSDELTTTMVATQARELLDRMKQAQHPFILGSECDVLSVPGKERTIVSKVEAFLHC